MPTYFHGTVVSDVITMVGEPERGGIDVALGGGEFGRGFYTQSSKSNALTWAQNHRGEPENACLLEVAIEDEAYARLQIRLLDTKQAKRLTQRIRKRKATRTHVEGVDVVTGPLNGSRRIQQQKFESDNAQVLLNGSQTRRRLI